MRRPDKIGSFYFPTGNEPEFSKSDFLQNLSHIVEETLYFTDKPGILLSGGIDSSLLTILAAKHDPDIPCFTVGQHITNPDVQAVIRLAKEKNLNLYIHLLNSGEILLVQQELKKISSNIYKGDDCVFAALKFASQFVTGIIATDGIDELMGGYWEHRDRRRFPSIRNTFKYFWNELEEKHLSPLCRSAEFHKLNLVFIYLLPQIVKHLSRIPLEDRIKGNIGKAVWKEIAQMAGVPQWIIERKKQGFVHAFNK